MRAYSQFPQPDLHRLDTRPYGLRMKSTKHWGRPDIARLFFFIHTRTLRHRRMRSIPKRTRISILMRIRLVRT